MVGIYVHIWLLVKIKMIDKLVVLFTYLITVFFLGVRTRDCCWSPTETKARSHEWLGKFWIVDRICIQKKGLFFKPWLRSRNLRLDEETQFRNIQYFHLFGWLGHQVKLSDQKTKLFGYLGVGASVICRAHNSRKLLHKS